MKKTLMILPVVMVAALTGSVSAGNAKELPVVKATALDALKKQLPFSNRRRFGQRIYATGRAYKYLKADLVTVRLGISADGSDAGAAVSALTGTREKLLADIGAGGMKVVRSQISNLRVNARTRRNYVDGIRQTVKVYRGTLSVAVTFSASDNVMADIARISSDKINRIDSMRFSFSKLSWKKQTDALKQEALARAEAQAEDRAASRNRKLGQIMRRNVTVQFFNPRGYNTRDVNIRASARVTYATE